MNKKRITLIFTFIISLLLIGTTKVNADTIDINEIIIDFEGYVPVVGEAPKKVTTNSNEYEIVYQSWSEYDSTGNLSNEEVTKFEYGKTYSNEMYIKPKDGYTSFLNQAPVITTKNITWNDIDGISKSIVTNPDNQYYGYLHISGEYTTGTIHANVEIAAIDNLIPIIGKTPQTLGYISEEYEIVSEDWYDEDLNAVTTFKKDKTYYYVLTIKSKKNYGWDGQSTLEVTNIDWESTYSNSDAKNGTLTFAGTIIPVEEEVSIDIQTNGGVFIGQTGPLSGPKGFSRSIAIIAEEGYKITKITVNGVEQTLPLEKDELSFTNIQENIIVVVTTEKDDTPKQIDLFDDSINQEFILGIDKTINFTLKYAPLAGSVFVDGVKLSEDNGDYRWAFVEGTYPSIQLSETYLNTLKSGIYTIKFVIDGEGEAETVFSVIDQNEKESSDGITGIEPETNNSNNPQTGDNVIAFIIIFSISAIGLIITTRYQKKFNRY